MSSFKSWISDSLDKYKAFKTFSADSKYVLPCAHDEGNRHSASVAIEKEKETLQELLIDLEKISKFDEEDSFKVLAVRALLNYDIGCLEVQNGCFRSGGDRLLVSWQLINDVSLDPQYCMLALNILNRLGSCLIYIKENLEALSYLQKAECLYHSYKKNSSTCPRDVANVLSVNYENEESWKPFEVAYASTLYYLAQVNYISGEVQNAAKYYQLFLSRHKDFVELNEKDWASKAIALSEFYIIQKDYSIARHLLSCASYVLLHQASPGENEQVRDGLSCMKAHLSLIWALYCQALTTDIMIGELRPKLLQRPPRLNVDPEVMAIEVKAPLSVTTLSEAKNAFFFGQHHLKEAELHYTHSLEPHKYFILGLCHTSLYAMLIGFEKDLGQQTEMHKRRVDILEDRLSKISVQRWPYKWDKLLVLLGGALFCIARNKLALLKCLPQGESQNTTKEIKALFLKAIGCLEKVLQRQKGEDGAFPEVFSDDGAEHALLALYYLCKNYELINSLDLRFEELINYDQLRKYHKFILDYVKKNPNHLHYIEKHLPTIERMGECFSPND